MPAEIAIAIVEFKGRFLVGVRDSQSVLSGYDEFPGGKVKPGESPSQAAERECFEETGVKIEAQQLLTPVVEHTYEHGALRLHFLRCRPTPPSEAMPKPPFRWVDREVLARLRFPEANRLAVDSLLESSP